MWRVVYQPNGRYARFCSGSMDFTHMDLSYEEIVNVCAEDVGMSEACIRVNSAKRYFPKFWNDCNRIMRERMAPAVS